MPESEYHRTSQPLLEVVLIAMICALSIGLLLPYFVLAARTWRSSAPELVSLASANDSVILSYHSRLDFPKSNDTSISKRQKQDPLSADFDSSYEDSGETVFEFDEFGYPRPIGENPNADYQYYDPFGSQGVKPEKQADIRRTQPYEPLGSYPPPPKGYYPEPKYPPYEPPKYMSSGKKHELKIFGPPTTYGVSIFRPMGNYYPGAADGYGAGSGPINPYPYNGPPAPSYAPPPLPYAGGGGKQIRFNPIQSGRYMGKPRAHPRSSFPPATSPVFFSPSSSAFPSANPTVDFYSETSPQQQQDPNYTQKLECRCVCPCDGKRGGYPVSKR